MRDKRILDLARDQPCQLCGRQDGTTVAAHYSGKYSSSLGKGMGQKAWDHCVAYLCHACHQDMDSYTPRNDEDRAVRFMLAIFRTQRLWLKELLK